MQGVGAVKTSYWTQVAAMLRKDMMVEMRAKESVPAMAIFAVATLVVFHFGLGRDALSGGLASGVLWVTILFASILGINRLFVGEFENSDMEGVLLAPIDRTAIYLSKGLALLIYLVILEAVTVPVFTLFFLNNGQVEIVTGLLPVLALADLGLAAAGSLTAAITVHARAREMVLPIVMLPLMVPLVIAAGNATEPIMAPGSIGSPSARWLLILALFDTIFALLAFAVFDFLLEE